MKIPIWANTLLKDEETGAIALALQLAPGDITDEVFVHTPMDVDGPGGLNRYLPPERRLVQEPTRPPRGATLFVVPPEKASTLAELLLQSGRSALGRFEESRLYRGTNLGSLLVMAVSPSTTVYLDFSQEIGAVPLGTNTSERLNELGLALAKQATGYHHKQVKYTIRLLQPNKVGFTLAAETDSSPPVATPNERAVGKDSSEGGLQARSLGGW